MQHSLSDATRKCTFVKKRREGDVGGGYDPNFMVQRKRGALRIDEEERREDVIINSGAGRMKSWITALHADTTSAFHSAFSDPTGFRRGERHRQGHVKLSCPWT